MSVSDITAYLAPTVSSQPLRERSHAVQFYDNDEYLLGSVSEFIGVALRGGGAGIVIATREHLEVLASGWRAEGIDLETARERGQYVALEAADTLEKLLLDGWPQERRFAEIVEPLIARAARCHPAVRAFGEMVGLLCAQGWHGAAVRLEELWEEITHRHAFSLLCAYPMSGFGISTDAQPLLEVCRRHTHVLPTERYASIGAPRERLLMITQLQQKARALEREVQARTAAERVLARQENDLREVGRRKDEFLATLAHELRNPLAPIRNAVEILRVAEHDRAVSARARQLIERQVKHLVRLLDDLLDVSRITQDRLELRRERMDIAAAVQLGLETSTPQIESKQHRITINWSRVPLYVEADATRMAQVFANILNNSAKYSRNRSSITVTLRREADRAAVEVTDTGYGIPAEMLPRIFDMFQRVNRGSEHTQDGLGIGLTLVKRVVELHGGDVEARSEGPDLGCTFTVRLPLWRESAEEQPSPALSSRPRAGSFAPRRRILVVDDNRDSATSLAMMLSLEGHDVRRAYDGVDALEIARQFHPEVVLLDIGMPRLDGYAVARELRGQLWARGVLLIAVTGWGQEEHKRRTSEAGFDGHLVKPVKPEVLRDLLEELRVRL
jgi:signal transduction histidine kinase/CheY-like chemotaxis protein